MTPFQCNIANPSKRVIGKPSTPTRCDGKPPCYLYPKWGNITNVCAKTHNPMYWANNQGNNMQMPTNWQCAPMYDNAYGFPDGAQNQIFVDNPVIPAGSVGDTLYSNITYGAHYSLSSNPATILVSPSILTKLVVQGDGNVVLYDVNDSQKHWATNTDGKGVGPYTLTLGQDGNLVLKDSTGAVLWASNTSNLPGAFAPYRLKLRDILTLTIVDSNSTPLWSATIN